jgi:hypothetical protein
MAQNWIDGNFPLYNYFWNLGSVASATGSEFQK